MLLPLPLPLRLQALRLQALRLQALRPQALRPQALRLQALRLQALRLPSNTVYNTTGENVTELYLYVAGSEDKGALKMLTRNIASEYGEYNIQCNGMGPGYIAIAQTAPLREIQPDGSRHPFDTFICAKTPAGRWGTPEDMVGPCVFLASHASDFVNGQILYTDGGILAYIGKQPK